jgi:hypothetical protein
MVDGKAFNQVAEIVGQTPSLFGVLLSLVVSWR